MIRLLLILFSFLILQLPHHRHPSRKAAGKHSHVAQVIDEIALHHPPRMSQNYPIGLTTFLITFTSTEMLPDTFSSSRLPSLTSSSDRPCTCPQVRKDRSYRSVPSDQGTIVVACPAYVIEITPAQAHLHVEESFSAAILPILTVEDPGVHGEVVTGMHG